MPLRQLCTYDVIIRTLVTSTIYEEGVPLSDNMVVKAGTFDLSSCNLGTLTW